MIHVCIRPASGAADNASMHRARTPADPRQTIRALRDKRGFASDRALAIAAGIPQPTLARYLNETTGSMDIKNFHALARVLEVTVSELLGEVPLGATSNARLRELTDILDSLPEPERRAWLAAGHAMADAIKSQ